MFDWIKSRFPGRNGKYDVPLNTKNDIMEKSKSRVQQDQQHKVQVTVTKNKEINIISPSAEIVEVTASFKQNPIENFLTSDDEPVSSAAISFKDFSDCSSRLCSQLNSVDSNSLEQNFQISDCVLVDLIQFKEQNSKIFSYETDSDSGISSLSCQSSSLSCQSSSLLCRSSSLSCESLASNKNENTIRGHTKADSRTSLYLSDSEYSFDSQCQKLSEMCRSNLSGESVCLSDNGYSFDCDSNLQSESQTIDQSRTEHFSCEREPQSNDQDRTEHTSKNSVCLSDSYYSFNSDSKSQHSVKLGKRLTQSISKSSVCLSDSNYSFDTNTEGMLDALVDELPIFNPKIGFGLNRWYKH